MVQFTLYFCISAMCSAESKSEPFWMYCPARQFGSRWRLFPRSDKLSRRRTGIPSLPALASCLANSFPLSAIIVCIMSLYGASTSIVISTKGPASFPVSFLMSTICVHLSLIVITVLADDGIYLKVAETQFSVHFRRPTRSLTWPRELY